MNSGIYTITNIANGKIYVGYTTDFNWRKYQHFISLKGGYHRNEHLQYAWNKYGENSFMFEILEECEYPFLVALEHYWCTVLETHNREYGYNIVPTSYNGINKRISEETKIKIRKARVKQVIGEQQRKKVSDFMKGNKWRLGKKSSNKTKKKISTSISLHYRYMSDQVKIIRGEKISRSKKGKKFGEAYSKACRQRRLGTKLSESCKEKITEKSRALYYRPFDVFKHDGSLLKSYTHIIDMVRDLGLKDNACQFIGQTLKGKYKSAYGYILKLRENKNG